MIPHGITDDFRRLPQRQQSIAAYSWSRPFRWLYVSHVDVYKHQWHVVEAVAFLRQKNIPVALDLVGSAPYLPALRRLQEVMRCVDPQQNFIHYHGPVLYSQLANYYHQADGFVFASSCETFGQILLEAMASGLPIACSEQSAMPEVLGDAGVYFDPEDPQAITGALYCLMMDAEKRERCSRVAYERAFDYSWEHCANETFRFIAEVAQKL